MSILATTRAHAPTAQAEWTYAAEAPPPSGAISTKPPAYVLGEQIGKVFKLFQSTHPKSTSCYDDIVKKYPDISPGVKETVRIICSNADDSLSFPYLKDYTRDELEAIGAAIGDNSALKTLHISWDIQGDDTEGIAPLIRALRKNKTLENLSLDASLHTPANVIFVQNLPCFHLNSIDFSDIFEVTESKYLSEALANSHLKISNISFPWWHEVDDGAGLVAEGLAKSTCLSTARLYSLGGNEHVNLFTAAMETSAALSHVSINMYNEHETGPLNRTILFDSLRSNTCISDFKLDDGTDDGPPKDLLEEIANITKGRTPCERSSTCATPLTNCPNPPKAPAGQDDEPLSPAAWFFIGAASIATVLGLTGLAVWLRQKGKQKTEPLLDQ